MPRPVQNGRTPFGALAEPGPADASEVRRLQQRIQELESELARIQAENDALTAAASHESLLEDMDTSSGEREPISHGSNR
ncbi:hypothetical protein [Streptomyces endophyticus]|uniref:hypothetical protein n=1 Tax=Streptomyces endophyticus TaxID=714166 RepID=UPI00389AA869